MGVRAYHGEQCDQRAEEVPEQRRKRSGTNTSWMCMAAAPRARERGGGAKEFRGSSCSAISHLRSAADCGKIGWLIEVNDLLGSVGQANDRPLPQPAQMAASHVPADVLSRTQMVFGQAESVKYSIDEGFRRVDNLSAKTRRLFKRTGDSTARTLLDQKEAAATAPPPEPKAWRDTWLRAPPNDMELMIAAQVGRPTIDPEIAMLHEEERNVWRAGSALFRDQQLQLQEELQQQQKWMWHRPAPPARRAPPQAPPASGGGTTAQGEAAAAATQPQPPLDPQHAVGRRRRGPTRRSARQANRAQRPRAVRRRRRRAPHAATAAPSPLAAACSGGGGGGGGGGTSPRSAVLDQPEPPSVSRSLRVREDLRSLLYDVQAAKAAEERRKADAESEALERALERARHASSSCTGEASAPAPSMHPGATRRAPPTLLAAGGAAAHRAAASGSFTPRPSAGAPAHRVAPTPAAAPPVARSACAVRPRGCSGSGVGAGAACNSGGAATFTQGAVYLRGRPCAGERAAGAGAAPGAASTGGDVGRRVRPFKRAPIGRSRLIRRWRPSPRRLKRRTRATTKLRLMPSAPPLPPPPPPPPRRALGTARQREAAAAQAVPPVRSPHGSCGSSFVIPGALGPAVTHRWPGRAQVVWCISATRHYTLIQIRGATSGERAHIAVRPATHAA